MCVPALSFYTRARFYCEWFAASAVFASVVASASDLLSHCLSHRLPWLLLLLLLPWLLLCSRLPCCLGFYRSFMPRHRTWLLCSWLIMAPEAFAPAFDFACSRSASIQKPCIVFVSCLCSFLQKYLLFCPFYTRKRTKCTLFRIFCAKYLAVSKKCITFASHLKKSSDRRRAEPWPSL